MRQSSLPLLPLSSCSADSSLCDDCESSSELLPLVFVAGAVELK